MSAFVYAASHMFHYGNQARGIMSAAGSRLGAAYTADTLDHTRSHGLRYISNRQATRPGCISTCGSAMATFFGALGEIGFLDREEALIVSNVFAEDESWEEVSRFQLQAITDGIAAARASLG
jgi:myo-inositol catabolism protein IolH